MRRFLVAAAVVGTLAAGAAGCGGSEGSNDGASGESTAEALEQVQAIPALLDDAVATYKSGDHEAAAEAVGDVYLEHYEDVEGPLGDRNHDLMEELEEQISTELRQAMEGGRPEAEIDGLVAEIKTNLEQAERELA